MYTYSTKKILTKTLDSLDELMSDFSNFDWSMKEDKDWDIKIKDTENKLELSLDLPGVDKATLEVTVHNNELKMSAERKGKKILKKFTWQYEFDDVKASYVDGVLQVTATPIEQNKPRRIEIN